jgi:dimethylamine monooxygenase subunit A
LHNAPPLPFLSGVYSTGPGLVPLSKNGLPDNRIFDIDGNYDSYLENKQECRQSLSKHFCTKDFHPATEASACNFVARELARSYPKQFTYSEVANQHKLENKVTGDVLNWKGNVLSNAPGYESLFDAISNQVQEDLAVFQIEEGRDWLAGIHLCAPNHWNPQDKVGSSLPGNTQARAGDGAYCQSIQTNASIRDLERTIRTVCMGH